MVEKGECCSLEKLFLGRVNDSQGCFKGQGFDSSEKYLKMTNNFASLKQHS